jgi:competence protein ComEA
MHGLLQSFAPIFTRYKIEVILLAAALIISITSLIIYTHAQTNSEEIITNQEKSNPASSSIKTFVVDIAGAVEKPGVYKVSFGARLKDVLQLANGLNSDADQGFFNRNYNLARLVSDQEKIYIPTMDEINNGTFNENKRTLDYSSPVVVTLSEETDAGQTTNVVTNTKISLNSATPEELDTLPGVGQATAQKIVNGRPYSAITDLINKKVVSKNVYDQITNLIEL